MINTVKELLNSLQKRFSNIVMKDKLNDIVIMATEPVSNMTPTDVRNYFAERKTEKDLADAFAIVSNEFWWVEDNVYDYEEGTQEYRDALAITDEWGALMDEYEEKIFEILRSEGVGIPDTERRKVLEPFMRRNGYKDGSGWWIKIRPAPTKECNYD